MKNLKMFCPVYGIPIQKCVTFARRLGPVFTAILSALALVEKSPGHICTHLPKGVAPPRSDHQKNYSPDRNKWGGGVNFRKLDFFPSISINYNPPPNL